MIMSRLGSGRYYIDLLPASQRARSRNRSSTGELVLVSRGSTSTSTVLESTSLEFDGRSDSRRGFTIIILYIFNPYFLVILAWDGYSGAPSAVKLSFQSITPLTLA